MPVTSRPSPATPFHSLQATSHALQPMHTDVSVKKPIRGGGSACPAFAATSGSGPASRLRPTRLLIPRPPIPGESPAACARAARPGRRRPLSRGARPYTGPPSIDGHLGPGPLLGMTGDRAVERGGCAGPLAETLG